MTPEVFLQLAEESHKALHRHHLHDALYLINILLKDLQLSEAMDDCQQLNDNYNRMLQFISDGGIDENSESIRGKMLEKALRLLIIAERAYRLQNQENTYTAAHGRIVALGGTIADLCRTLCEATLYTQERELALDNLFYAIWTSAPFTAKERIILTETMHSVTENELCVITSALTIALQEYVDEEKLILLINLLDSELVNVKVRALTGIILCATGATEDLMLHTELNKTLSSILQRTDIQQIVADLNLSFLICLQTQQAREKMEKDILPNFMKLAKDVRVELGLNEDGDLNMDLPANNAKERKELNQTIKQFLDMHHDGIDMNANTMLVMRNMPFFKELPHWFLPFDKNRTEIRELTKGQEEESLEMMDEMQIITGSGDCDPDRYSMVLMFLKHLSKDTKETISQLAHRIKVAEDFRQDELAKSTPSTQVICRLYMRLLYRVYHIYPKCSEWSNPFNRSTNWLQNPVLSPALDLNRAALHNLTDLLVKYKNYQEAEAYLNRLVQLEGSDAATLRAAAYCKQQQGHFGGAINLYTQADLLEPNHTWTLAQMQLCYAHLDRHEQRLDCLLQLEKLEPENAKVISETGLCLMQLKRWQDASQRFYRLELEERCIVPSQRAIAWCAMQQGKLEQAMKYYRILLESPSAIWQDFLNAGHASWLSGNTTMAISYYRGYIKRYLTDDPKITDALTPFNADNDLLLSLGKCQHEIDLMHDILAPLTPERE